ncbi:hypothetical protein [Hyphococcus sp.]|uniref:hypothetical protein n=1 Tax=Hyphococcus sp. TaxID=2038636 RepID=UPI003752D8FF
MYALVCDYAGFGDHKTGSDAERATNEWLLHYLKPFGFRTKTLPFNAGVRPLQAAHIACEGQEITCAAQLRTPGTDATGVAGKAFFLGIAEPASSASVAICDLPYQRWSEYEHPAIETAVRDAIRANAKALVCITNGPTGETCTINAPESAAKSPIPIVYIGPAKAAMIRQAAYRHAPLTVTVRHGSQLIQGANICATNYDTQKPLANAIVISTPTTGWGPCAGERGPGVAIALKLAAWFVESRFELPVQFIFTSGHELGFAGMRAMLKSSAPRPHETAAWLHLGANVAARDYHETQNGLLPLSSADPQRYAMASADWLGKCHSAFAGEPGLEHPYPADVSAAAGELRIILEAEYSSILGIFGANRFHHTALDTPSVTTPALLARAAHAVQKALVSRISDIKIGRAQTA